MILNGKEIPKRKANHKYYQLDNLNELFEKLKVKCIADVAKDLNVPANCIDYRVREHFPDEWKAQIVKKRVHKKD